MNSEYLTKGYNVHLSQWSYFFLHTVARAVSTIFFLRFINYERITITIRDRCKKKSKEENITDSSE